MPRPHGKQAVTWWGATAPATGPTGTASVWVQQYVEFTVAGRVQGFRVYRKNGDTQAHIATLATNPPGATLLRAKAFFDDTALAAGWHNCWIVPNFRVTPNVQYLLAVLMPGGQRFRTVSGVNSGTGTAHGSITFFGSSVSTNLDPTQQTTIVADAQGVDVLFLED